MAYLSGEEIELYSHSSVHSAIARRDHAALSHTLQNLPALPNVNDVSSEEDSRIAEAAADRIADVIDRRDVPGGESPLHLAVRLQDAVAVEMLMAAGANWSLHNEQGWSALQEAVCAKEEEIAMIISRYYLHMGWMKWCRRMPLVTAAVRKIRNFYMEITFHFESSVIPFIGRIAPSDTYRIWKRGSNLRADMTIAGYDGLRVQRSHQSVLLLGDGSEDGKIRSGSLLVLFHKDKEVTNATEGGSAPPSETAEIAHKAAIMSPNNVYRVGIDVTQAELVPQMNWRRHERFEWVGLWRTKIFDMHRLLVSIKSRRVPGAVADEGSSAAEMKRRGDQDDLLTEEEKQQLENVLGMEDLDSGDEGFDGGNGRVGTQPEGFNHAESTGENDELSSASTSGRSKNNAVEPVSSERDRRNPWFIFGQKPVKQEFGKRHPWFARSRGAMANRESVNRDGSSNGSSTKISTVNGNLEREYNKRLRPVLWLSPDFPIKTEELLPILDILANRVKAVWRLRELLTTKLPAGLFPVKVAVPVFPTIRMVVTFTKFQELPATEGSCAPPSSPARSQGLKGKVLEKLDPAGRITGPGANRGKTSVHYNCAEERSDPFMVPSDYTWVDMKEKRRRMKETNARSENGKTSSFKSPDISSQNGK